MWRFRPIRHPILTFGAKTIAAKIWTPEMFILRAVRLNIYGFHWFRLGSKNLVLLANCFLDCTCYILDTETLAVLWRYCCLLLFEQIPLDEMPSHTSQGWCFLSCSLAGWLVGPFSHQFSFLSTTSPARQQPGTDRSGRQCEREMGQTAVTELVTDRQM